MKKKHFYYRFSIYINLRSWSFLWLNLYTLPKMQQEIHASNIIQKSSNIRCKTFSFELEDKDLHYFIRFHRQVVKNTEQIAINRKEINFRISFICKVIRHFMHGCNCRFTQNLWRSIKRYCLLLLAELNFFSKVQQSEAPTTYHHHGAFLHIYQMSSGN